MKTLLSNNKLTVFSFIFILAFLFSSCLSEGEETIALEQGNLKELVLGQWKIDRVEIYDEDHKYVSDVPTNELNKALITFEENYQGKIQDLNGEISSITWDSSDDNSTFTLDDITMKLVSLGKNVFVLEGRETVNSDLYTARYIFKKVSSNNQPDETIQDEAKVISSSESGSLGLDGIKLTVPFASVPKNQNGQDGHVAFSIQRAESLPKALPNGMSPIGAFEDNGYRIEPMNFTFKTPLLIDIPLSGYNPDEIAILHFNEYTEQWEEIPFAAINGNSIQVNVLELGTFVIVKKSSNNNMGGIRIPKEYLDPNYYYYLTLVSVDGSNFTKRISYTSHGKDLYMLNIPFGEYKCYISRELRNSFDSNSGNMETSLWVEHIYINQPIYITSGNMDSYEGWTELEDFKYADWIEERPDEWGDVTVTYGTGEFQATLTWVNTTSAATDYDLHLFGPNNLHVYYSHKNEGAFELDRDWLTQTGNAIENIYSIEENFTPGTYTVKVHHYSGNLNKRYNCRILVNGVVVKSVSGIISTNKEFDDIYTFTVE